MSPWIPWFYNYLVGTAFILPTVYLCHKSGALNLKRKDHRALATMLVAGLVGFAGLHGLWILFTIS